VRAVDRRQSSDAPRFGGRKLLDQVRVELRTRYYSRRTEQAYVLWVRRFVIFHGRRHPAEMGEREVAQFLSNLAEERKVAASTQSQAASALIFLYKKVLRRDIAWIDDVARARAPRRIPVVLTCDEMKAVLQELHGTKRLVATLLYGSGLRLIECLQLRVKDIDFGLGQLVVRRGKGAKDRVTILPSSSREALGHHLARVRCHPAPRRP
jgi:site-specific recombinase XerD